MKTQYHTESQVRAAFWSAHPQIPRRFSAFEGQTGKRYYHLATQNAQPCDTRAAFVEFVDSLARDGAISESLASQVTL